MNRLRPGSIARIDPREDGKLRTSNVTKFLASCSANGLPPEDLFLRDDLIEGTSDCLARVAKTIITLVKWAETPVPTHSRFLRGGGSKSKPINVTLANAAPGLPYRTGSSSSRAVMSSPTCPLSIPRHHYHRTHHALRRSVRPSIGHQLAFPRCGLTVQILRRPAMWGRRLGLIPKDVRCPRERRATATKCLRSSRRPVRHHVRAPQSVTHSSRRPETSPYACQLQIRRRVSLSPLAA
jgi:hypothetical protein